MLRPGLPLKVGLLVCTLAGVSACTCGEQATLPEATSPPAAVPAVAAPVEPAAETDDNLVREQRREDRKNARKTSFDNHPPVFRFSLGASDDRAKAARQRVAAITQPVAGVDLSWIRMDCTRETAWDSAEHALGGTGTSFLSVTKLEAEDCGVPEKARALVTTSVLTGDESVARLAHSKLAGVAASNKRAKVSVELISATPGALPQYEVAAREKVKGAAPGQAPTAQIVGAHIGDGGGTMVPVCDRSLLVERWVLEETKPRPEKAERPTKDTKKGDKRPPRERHRRWAELAIWSTALDQGALHAEVRVRAARAKETDPARMALATQVHADLAGAGLISPSTRAEALYRCGG
jgi:hypothetical protein